MLEAHNKIKVSPRSNDFKANIKAKYATQYIGFGVPNSATDLYSKSARELANTGNYSENDVIFCSINGGFTKERFEAQDRTIEEVLKAINSGATILVDNEEYLKYSKYNTGEKKLANTLREVGAVYSNFTDTDSNITIGVWKREIN